MTSAMRRVAKTVNFGVIYGISAHGLAQRLGMSREEAARFIDAYFARYPKVAEYQSGCWRNAGGTATSARSWAGAGRSPASGRDSTYQQRNQPEREAINMEIQGSAADLIKVAMLNIYRRLRRENGCKRGCCCRFTTSWCSRCRRRNWSRWPGWWTEEMTTALKLEVPLKVDLARRPKLAGRDGLSVAEFEVRRARPMTTKD